jgi:hypothetical protein
MTKAECIGLQCYSLHAPVAVYCHCPVARHVTEAEPPHVQAAAQVVRMLRPAQPAGQEPVLRGALGTALQLLGPAGKADEGVCGIISLQSVPDAACAPKSNGASIRSCSQISTLESLRDEDGTTYVQHILRHPSHHVDGP